MSGIQRDIDQLSIKHFFYRNWSGNHDGCLLMGVFNLNPCKGAPAIVSLPHFYLGSEELLEYIEEGIKPDREKHNSYLYLESVSIITFLFSFDEITEDISI